MAATDVTERKAAKAAKRTANMVNASRIPDDEPPRARVGRTHVTAQRVTH